MVVRSPRPEPLIEALAAASNRPDRPDATTLRVRGLEMEHVGHLAFTAGVELHELSTEKFDLEQLFFSLTEGAYAGQNLAGPPPAGHFAPPPGPPGPAAPQGGAPWSP